MTKEEEILEKTINALKKETGLPIAVQNQSHGEPIVNFGNHEKFAVHVQSRLSNSVIGSAVIQSKSSAKQYFLITDYVNDSQAARLRELQLCFADTVGNAYLRTEGTLILITGRRPPKETNKPINFLRPAGVKILLELLTNDGLLQKDYRTIEALTDIPRATIGWVFYELEQSGYLFKQRGHKRSLLKRDDLIQRWVHGFNERLRPTLKPERFRSIKFSNRWWEQIDPGQYNAVWGGETAGQILTGHLRPQSATLYADSMLPALQAKYALVRDPKGEIEILRRFWKSGEALNCAPPLVVYADLIGTADERNIETAQLLYEKYLLNFDEGAT